MTISLEHNRNFLRGTQTSYQATAYLQSRGIDKDIIKECISRGILYESKNFHSCVFVGHDKDGKAKFASVRATKSDFKQDAPGSSKQYGFSILGNKDSETVAVFESAIDLLSFATLEKQHGIDPKKEHKIALSGVSTMVLDRFLADNPQIRAVRICLDNDKTGRENSEKIKQSLENKGYQVKVNLPKQGKDYNELLTQKRTSIGQSSQISR